jgi:hypothetical protein
VETGSLRIAAVCGRTGRPRWPHTCPVRTAAIATSQQAKVPSLEAHRLFGMPEGHGLVFLADEANRVPVYVPAYYEIAMARGQDNPYFNSA